MKVESYRAQVPDIVLDQIAQIYFEAFTGPPRFENWTVDEIKTHLRKLISGDADVYLVVEGNSEIAAFGIGLPLSRYHNWKVMTENGASPDSYYFAELATREKFRKRGYGKLLQKRREQAALERGLSKLSVRVRADNPTTINMLEGIGFSKVAAYEGVTAGSVMERYIMEKSV